MPSLGYVYTVLADNKPVQDDCKHTLAAKHLFSTKKAEILKLLD